MFFITCEIRKSCNDCKEMFKKKCMCKVVVLLIQTYCIFAVPVAIAVAIFIRGRQRIL